MSLNSGWYCCAGWGYIAALTKVLTMYQIYHTWIHPFHQSPSYPPLGIIFFVDNGFFLSLLKTSSEPNVDRDELDFRKQQEQHRTLMAITSSTYQHCYTHHINVHLIFSFLDHSNRSYHLYFLVLGHSSSTVAPDNVVLVWSGYNLATRMVRCRGAWRQ
jgi:hypothetical protein